MKCLWQTVLAAMSLLVTGPMFAQNTLRSTLQPLADYFNDLKLVPIVVPRGQEVGDVFDAATLQFVYSARDCFPGAKPVTRSSTLPSFENTSFQTAMLAVGIPAIADALVGLGIERATQIGFTDLEVQTITENELRKSFDKAACPELDAAVNKKTATWFGRQLIVIGELYTGHRSLQLELQQTIDVQAKIKDLAVVFATGGIPVEISAAVTGNGNAKVIIRETKVFPLAVRPAFIARPLAVQSLGDGAAKSLETVRWEAFDPDLPSQKDLIAGLSKSVLEAATKTSKP